MQVVKLKGVANSMQIKVSI